uniref:Rhomboid-like protein n=1 Tax=Anopheles epiroticus TaxID=199890 RepID=A0A182P7F9_9DIPT
MQKQTTMADSRKPPPGKVVPVHRGKATTNANGSSTCQRAWIESDRQNRQPESEREPFLAGGGSGSEGSETSSLECEQLCTEVFKNKARIFAIDLERGRKRCEKGSTSTRIGSSDSANNDDSPSDTKLVDRALKVYQRKRQFCQSCPWTVPWSLLIVSALQSEERFNPNRDSQAPTADKSVQLLDALTSTKINESLER